MSELSEAEHFAVAAVAKQFSGTWEKGGRPPDAYLNVDGCRIALDVAVIELQRPSKKVVAKARLREDVVARRVVRDLEGALATHVPDRKTVIFTLGAPIKEPKKLVAALTNTLATYLASGAEDVDEKKTILGNRVRFRVHSESLTSNDKVVGFVFTGDPEPRILADAMRSLRDEIAAKAKTHVPKGFAGDRWLALKTDDRIADIKAYRRIYSLLSVPRGFAKILLMQDGGRIEALTE
jgi:hypothetical protein